MSDAAAPRATGRQRRFGDGRDDGSFAAFLVGLVVGVVTGLVARDSAADDFVEVV
jgi:hypothetical protein